MSQTSLALGSIERGLNCFYVAQTVRRGTRKFVWPVLYFIVERNGDLQPVRLESLLDFYEEHSARSHQWRVVHARAICLMIDSTVAQMALLSDSQRENTDEPIERYLLRQFALNVTNGTIDVDRNGVKSDRSGLFWYPRGKQADRLLAACSSYVKWLGDNTGAKRWDFAASVDDVKDNPVNAFRTAAELAIRRKRSFLSYLGGTEREPAHRFAAITGNHSHDPCPVYAFPAKYFAPMAFEAFRTDAGETDHTPQLIALILLAGGLRSCEPLHFYTTDVQFIADEPVLYMHHPQHGRIVYKNRSMSRSEFLLEKYGQRPRNKQSGPGKAGWKSVLGDETGTPVFWLPIPVLRQRIADLLRTYLIRIRPAIMRARPPHLQDHPFLFVNSRNAAAAGGGNIGDPYTLSAFVGAWERGIRRLARIYDDPALTVSKAKGTTRHGPRHLYGRVLRTLELPPDVIQHAMHHRSVFSQMVYTRLDSAQVNEILNRSAAREDLPDITTSMMISITNFQKYNSMRG